MFLALVLLLMLVLPAGSVLIERVLVGSAEDPLLLVGKWFVFWSVGARLFLAGLRQCVRPEFTAETILRIESKEAGVLVRELGFANLAMGTVGLCSLAVPRWVSPGAVAGAIFLGLAGIQHVTRKGRNHLENLAMVSNLFVCGVLLLYCFGVIARR